MVGNRKVALRLLFSRGVVLGVLLVAAGSCGGRSVGSVPDTGNEPEKDCFTLCKEAKAERCPGTGDKNCEDDCLKEDFVVEVTGCRKELDDSLRCSASLDDICDIPRSCAREIKAQL
ncbi:MAG TPA: hypothetical protein VGK73_14385, partial [Polyangiaceae bacterium]